MYVYTYTQINMEQKQSFFLLELLKAPCEVIKVEVSSVSRASALVRERGVGDGRKVQVGGLHGDRRRLYT